MTNEGARMAPTVAGGGGTGPGAGRGRREGGGEQRVAAVHMEAAAACLLFKFIGGPS
jgi:hypothetical protein